MRVPAPNTVAFELRGPLARADLPVLCDRVRALLTESDADVLLCEVSDVGRMR